MRCRLHVAAAVVLWASVALAQSPKPAEPAKSEPQNPGRELVQRKCYQCHQVGMWNSLRQDRNAWEATLYRMVGRGALWTEAEINAMAEFLAQTRGPKTP